MFILPSSDWEVRVTPNRGRGVFAKREIPGGAVIGDYLGKLMPDEYNEEYHEKVGFYCMEWNDKFSIFPDPEKPGVHLVNHSCEPNCDLIEHDDHVLYYALRKIFPGEELTVYYVIDPPSKDDPIEESCRCGSKLCRGVYHVDFSVDYSSDNTREPLVPFGEELPPLSKYPESIADDPTNDIFSSHLTQAEKYDESILPEILEIRKRIRETGKKLSFPLMKIEVIGVLNGILLAHPQPTK